MSSFEFLLAFLAGAICKTVFDWLVKPGKASGLPKAENIPPPPPPKKPNLEATETNMFIEDVVSQIPIEAWHQPLNRMYSYRDVFFVPRNDGERGYIKINSHLFYHSGDFLDHLEQSIYAERGKKKEAERLEIMKKFKPTTHVDK